MRGLGRDKPDKPGHDEKLFATASLPSLHQRQKARLLAAGGVEIFRREPALESGLAGRPLAVEHREPGGVAVASLDDEVLAEHAFEREAEALGGAPRGGIERVAFPLVTAVAQRL